jgi:hypothetical protein
MSRSPRQTSNGPRIRNCKRSAPIVPTTLPHRPMRAVAFSPNGRLLATARRGPSRSRGVIRWHHGASRVRPALGGHGWRGSLGAHPYQLPAGDRCAPGRSCRSRATVAVGNQRSSSVPPAFHQWALRRLSPITGCRSARQLHSARRPRQGERHALVVAMPDAAGPGGAAGHGGRCSSARALHRRGRRAGANTARDRSVCESVTGVGVTVHQVKATAYASRMVCGHFTMTIATPRTRSVTNRPPSCASQPSYQFAMHRTFPVGTAIAMQFTSRRAHLGRFRAPLATRQRPLAPAIGERSGTPVRIRGPPRISRRSSRR